MHWTLKRVRHKFTYNYLSYEKDLALVLTHFKTIIFYYNESSCVHRNNDIVLTVCV